MANYIATTEQFTATANAIRAKMSTTATIMWNEATGFADDINNISTGVDTTDANATTGDILDGKTAYVNGEKITGSLTAMTSAQIQTAVNAGWV